MTQEFHLSITPVHNNEYLVRTEQVAPGVPLAEEQLIWPVDDWLDQVRHLMNDPLVDLLQQGQNDGTAKSLNECVNSFMELGQQLYQHLFQGILRDSWTTARGIAQHRGEMLRLRLGLKGSKLVQLPWEVMHGHTRDGLGLTAHPLATGVDLLFSRYQPVRHAARFTGAITPSQSPVVHILMVIALPADQDILNLDQEARHLQQELRLQQDHLQGHWTGTLPDIQVTILQHPSRAELTHALEQSQYQVLHYAGHSDLGSDGGKLYLVDSKGLTEILMGDDLAGLLVNNGIQLAVFNSCRSGHAATAATSSDPSQRTLADALVRRGVPGVLAMAERIPDDVALTLTRLFYRNLKQGYPIDLSLSRSRQGLLVSYGSNQLYWALPTLYLHPDWDGYLTGGDRLLDNPADALIRAPRLHTPSLVDMELGSTSTASSTFGAYGTFGTPRAVNTSGTSSTSPVPRPMAGFQSQQPQEQPAQSSSRSIASMADITEDPMIDLVFQDTPTDVMDFAECPDTHTEPYALNNNLGNEVEKRLESDHHLAAEETAKLANDPPTYDLPTHHSVPNDLPQKSQTNVPPLTLQKLPTKQEATTKKPVLEESSANPVPKTLTHSPSANRTSTGRSTSSLVLHSKGRSPSTSIVRTASFSQQSINTEHRTRNSRPPRWLYPLTGAAAAIIAIVGYHAYEEIAQSPKGTASLPTEELVSSASAKLDMGELDEAQVFLDQVPKNDLDKPTVNFLQGRLIWELLKTDNTDFSFEDASRYWEWAVHSSQTPEYYNALGFSLYAEGRLNDAIEAWGEALMTLQEGGIEVVPIANPNESKQNGYEGGLEHSIGIPTETIADQDALTAYAGMALALAQLAGDSSTWSQSVDLMSKVAKIQQVVLTSAPEKFEPDALQANWLWTESAIKEWDLLSQIKIQ